MALPHHLPHPLLPLPGARPHLLLPRSPSSPPPSAPPTSDAALRFFRWAALQPSFPSHSLDSFVSIIDILCSDPDRARTLVRELRDSGLPLTPSSSASLVRTLAASGLIEELLWAWRHMKDCGIEPSRPLRRPLHPSPSPPHSFHPPNTLLVQHPEAQAPPRLPRLLGFHAVPRTASIIPTPSSTTMASSSSPTAPSSASASPPSARMTSPPSSSSSPTSPPPPSSGPPTPPPPSPTPTTSSSPTTATPPSPPLLQPSVPPTPTAQLPSMPLLDSNIELKFD